MTKVKSEYVLKKDVYIKEFAQRVAVYHGAVCKKRKDYKYIVSKDGKFITEIYLTRNSIRFEFKTDPVECLREIRKHDSKRYMELGYIYYVEFPDSSIEEAFEYAKGIEV